MAVGPCRKTLRAAWSLSAVARRTRVFLKILYSAPAVRSCRRKVARSPTLRPRYSVRIAAPELPRCSRTSSTTATFSGLGPAMSAPLIACPGPSPKTRLRRDHDAQDVGSAWHFASSGGTETLSAPFGAPEIYGELFNCELNGSRPPPTGRSANDGRAAQADAASSSSVSRALAGSIFTPGPIVELTVTDRR